MRDERDKAYSKAAQCRTDAEEAKAVIDTCREEIKGAEDSARRLCELVNVAVTETVSDGTAAPPASAAPGSVDSASVTSTGPEETSIADAPPVVRATPSGTPGQGLVQRVTGAMRLAKIKRFG